MSYKRKEKPINESLKLLELFIEKIPFAVAMFDLDMHYLAASHKWFSDYSLGKQDIIGHSHYEIFPDISDEWKNVHRRCLAGESANAEEDLYKRMDGTEQWMRWQIIPWKFGDGTIGGIIMFTEDITRRKKMDGQILRAQKLESLGILAGGIAHDFNNILTAILGNISIAKSFTESREELLNRLTEAEIATLRASELARQLLAFSKGGAPIKKLASIQRVIEHSVQFALSGSNIQSQIFFQEGLWSVEIDEGQIGQVIQNIVINAQQAMPSGGTIRVETKNLTIEENNVPGASLRKGDYLLILIQDHGTGISREHLLKIFDPYFTTKQKGSGLGLSIAYSIIQRHHGYITVESNPGVGTIFSIYLPACSDVLLSPEKKEVEVLTQGKGRILVMDDEESILRLAGETLERLGYETELAKNGTEAEAMYKKAKDSGYPFDLVITDLTVPGGMGGVETLKRLKEIDPQVKVIVSSGYSNDSAMSDYKESGFSECLMKPYRAFELSETVKRVLNAKKSE